MQTPTKAYQNAFNLPPTPNQRQIGPMEACPDLHYRLVPDALVQVGLLCSILCYTNKNNLDDATYICLHMLSFHS